MNLDLHQLDLRYEKLRRKSTTKERQLLGSLGEHGQLMPVIVVRSGEPSTGVASYVLLDGYKRVRALRRLERDTICAVPWELDELEALLLERLMRKSEADNALEQGFLLEELNERFGLSGEELARRFDKSQSWVSRRLGLVRALPREVQAHVQSGTLPAHAAMKYLLPMARAKRSDCVRLASALAKLRPSSRDVGALYAAWASADERGRELVLSEPSIVLRARHTLAAEGEKAAKHGQSLIDDFSIIIGTSRRARNRIAQGGILALLLSEPERARTLAKQARWESEALFGQAAALLCGDDGGKESVDAR